MRQRVTQGHRVKGSGPRNEGRVELFGSARKKSGNRGSGKAAVSEDVLSKQRLRIMSKWPAKGFLRVRFIDEDNVNEEHEAET